VGMQEENGGADGRIVVAFRGTQLGETIDCDADLCADAILWETPGAESCPLPAGMCDKFDDATLDYFSQAVGYTRKVIIISYVYTFCNVVNAPQRFFVATIVHFLMLGLEFSRLLFFVNY
jgi:hypothetical protein